MMDEGRVGSNHLAEIARLFTRLGFTAFGGPAVHTAMMEDEVVTRRRWIDRQGFLDLVGLLNFIPGPNSTELAIHLGLIRGGRRGLIVAGVCFITPAVIIILPLAWLYVHFGGGGATTPPAMVNSAMRGITAVVVAILAVAAYRFRAAAMKSWLTIWIAVLAFPADYLLRNPKLWLDWSPIWRDWVGGLQSEIVILTAAALTGVICSGVGRLQIRRPLTGLVPWLAMERLSPPGEMLSRQWSGLLASANGGGLTLELGRVAWFFFKIGITLFGSGYVLVSYLESGLVGQLHWLTPQQLSDAVAVGQLTPGPLLTTATFIGFVRGYAVSGSDWGGVAGALVATVAIFAPAFVLVAMFGNRLRQLGQKPWARAALDGMSAAVMSLLAVVTVRFAFALQVHQQPDWPRIAIAGVALGLMLWKNVNSTWLILGAAIAGMIIKA